MGEGWIDVGVLSWREDWSEVRLMSRGEGCCDLGVMSWR